MNDQELRVLQALCRHGLRLSLDQLGRTELRKQIEDIRLMLHDNTAEALVLAIQYGMPNVWPFTEGRAFDARDLKSNLLKAKAESRTKVRAGEIPYRLKTREDREPEAPGD